MESLSRSSAFRICTSGLSCGTYAFDSALPPKKLYFRNLVASLRKMQKGGGEGANSDTDRSRAYTPAKEIVEEREPAELKSAGAWMKPSQVREMVKLNCSLIKTVPRGRKMKGVERRIKRLFENTNTTRDTLARYLEGKCGLEDYQAERLINDQIIKYNARAELERLRKQGVKTVRWVHGDSHEPRPSHISSWPHGLNGCVFPIDSPPVDPATGRRIYPGEEILCSCRLEAVE